jgi:uncharacterized membrane protein YbhN (UPF0104 family)
MVWAVGLDPLLLDLRALGWGLPLVLSVESLSVVFNTWGWGLSFPAGERRISSRRLFAARMAGDGVNYLTPSATVGGEVLRVRLLGSGVPLGLRWASVSVAKLGQTAAQALFVILGLGLVLPTLTATASWVAWLGTLAAGALVGLAFAWVMGRGIWTTLDGLVRRLGLRRVFPAAWAGHGRDLDAALARITPWRLGASVGCFLAGWAVGALEIYLILAWLGGPVDWTTALAVETGSVLIDGILFFVPGKVGTQEGGKVALFAALGLSPARGLTVGIVRRLRELAYAGAGLAALGFLAARPTLPETFFRSEPS